MSVRTVLSNCEVQQKIIEDQCEFETVNGVGLYPTDRLYKCKRKEMCMKETTE